jgi:hypothetical protein
LPVGISEFGNYELNFTFAEKLAVKPLKKGSGAESKIWSSFKKIINVLDT